MIEENEKLQSEVTRLTKDLKVANEKYAQTMAQVGKLIDQDKEFDKLRSKEIAQILSDLSIQTNEECSVCLARKSLSKIKEHKDE